MGIERTERQLMVGRWSQAGFGPIARRRLCAWLCILSSLAYLPVAAQELEPRAYSPNPIGLNFLLLSVGHSSGDVLIDSSLPLSNVEAQFNAPVAGYGHTFGLFDHVASATIAVPYVIGRATGDVGNDQREAHRSGVGDTQLRFAVNLLGGPALTAREFATRVPRTTLGFSLTIVAPTGQYDDRKLINIGSNRWAFKPQLGVSQPIGKWFVEGYVGAWLFTDNPDFYGGARREQQPVGTLQGHVSYEFQSRLWLAADITYYAGGSTTVNGIGNDDRQSNSRAGLTLSVPFGTRQSMKLSWSRGATVRVGGDFTTFAAAWQYAWLN